MYLLPLGKDMTFLLLILHFGRSIQARTPRGRWEIQLNGFDSRIEILGLLAVGIIYLCGIFRLVSFIIVPSECREALIHLFSGVEKT